MHYYIYPKNWDGEDIAFNLSRFDRENTYHFIDDGKEELSLQNQANAIRQDNQSLVLIASKYRYFDLAAKLESQGITNYVDGLKFCASKLALHYLEKSASKINRLCVGLLVTQLPHSEHVRHVIDSLQAKNLPIVFITTDRKSFENYSQNYPSEYVILSRCDLTEQLDFLTVAFATTSYVRFHSNVVSILNPQGLLDPVQNYFYLNRERVDLLIGSRVNFDYIFCHTKEMLEVYQYKLAGSLQENRFLTNPLKFIPVGYPSLDSYLQESYQNKESNTVLLAFTIINPMNEKNKKKDESGISFEILCELVQSLLDKKYKVVLRPHPEKSKAIFMDEIAKKFENTVGGGGIFVYDTSSRMSKQLMEEAFTIIGHGSSVMQTFPLATLKPAILFIPDKDFFVRNDLDSKFVANQTTHFLTHSVNEVLEVCNKIKQNSKTYYDEIQAYRAEHIYNLGHSGEFIADFIEKLVLKVQNDYKYIEMEH